MATTPEYVIMRSDAGMWSYWSGHWRAVGDGFDLENIKRYADPQSAWADDAAFAEDRRRTHVIALPIKIGPSRRDDPASPSRGGEYDPMLTAVPRPE